MSILRSFKQNLCEDVLTDIQKIVNDHQSKKIKFSDGYLEVDGVTANMLLTVYKALKNESSQLKFKEMLNKSIASFMKLVDFGWKQVK